MLACGRRFDSFGHGGQSQALAQADHGAPQLLLRLSRTSVIELTKLLSTFSLSKGRDCRWSKLE